MAPGLIYPEVVLARMRGPHKAIGLYAHLTWHTWYRRECIAETDVPVIVQAVHSAAERTGFRVCALGILSDHVHLIVSYPPDATVSSLIREAKSESARRVNEQRSTAELRWCRGYYANSLSQTHVPAAKVYVANQRSHHPDRVPIWVG